MNTTPMIQENQRQKLIQYLSEARSKYMYLLYIAAGGSILFLLPALQSISVMQVTRDLLPEGYASRGSTYLYIWILFVIIFAALFLMGFQRKFGKNAPINCIRRNDFTCEYVTVSQLSDIQGRPPYLMTDTLGTQFVVPVFLECKQMRIGMQVIGIYAADGSRFAMLDPANMPEI